MHLRVLSRYVYACLLLKNRKSMNTSEDLIGFIDPVLNWVASPLARREQPEKVWKVFIGRNRKRKEKIVSGKVNLL